MRVFHGLSVLHSRFDLRDCPSQATYRRRSRMKSPCISVCRFDGRTGWCVACGRTLPECREWKKAPRPRLLAISKALPARLAKLDTRGVRVIEEEA